MTSVGGNVYICNIPSVTVLKAFSPPSPSEFDLSTQIIVLKEYMIK